jgi:hypothetical protein
MSITAAQALARYGDPTREKAMVLYDVPTALEIGAVPRRVYCNRDLVGPLSRALGLIVERDLTGLLRTWDGCFQVRRKRGRATMSLHSWGLAVDINAAWNPLGAASKQDPRLTACFVEAGFAWGGAWRGRLDCMHYELAALPRLPGVK